MSYKRDTTGKYVYFLRRADGVGPVKIGCSRLPRSRLREFYRWSPYELTILAASPAGHRMFAAYKLHMEWFAPSDRLMTMIARVYAGMPIREAMEQASVAPVAEPHQARAA